MFFHKTGVHIRTCRLHVFVLLYANEIDLNLSQSSRFIALHIFSPRRALVIFGRESSQHSQSIFQWRAGEREQTVRSQ